MKNEGVASRGFAYMEMEKNWGLVRTLLGGTSAMRLAGETFLPKYGAELQEDYLIRLKRAVLTNYYGSTVKHLVGKAFAKPLVLQEDVPVQIQEWAEDIDLQGTHLNDFAANLFAEALGIGFAGIMVDYPKQLPGVSLAEERASGARPYFGLVPAENILGVTTGKRASDIVMARLCEEVVVPDGEYGEKLSKRIRVLIPGGYRLYEMMDKDEYILVEEGSMSPMTRVPLVPVYGKKVRAWVGIPPLLDLAYKNVQNYQMDSDVDNAIRVACFPMLAVSGWDVESDPKIKVGPNVVLATSDPAGRFYYVEHSGAAINAGRQRMEDLKAEMAMMGLQMMMPRASGDATATETQVKYAEATSDLQRMAFSLKDSLENALQIMAEWVGLPDGGSIEIKGQFALPRDAASEVQALIALRAGGEITSKTLLSELKRRDFLPDDFDVEGEQELLAMEGPGYEVGQ